MNFEFEISRVNSIALTKAKNVCNFGLSECNRVNGNSNMRLTFFPLSV